MNGIRAATIVLFIGAALLGMVLMDNAKYRKMELDLHKTIDTRFQEHSTKLGAWVMDRDAVAAKIGIEVQDLPSFKWAEQRRKEGKTP